MQIATENAFDIMQTFVRLDGYISWSPDRHTHFKWSTASRWVIFARTLTFYQTESDTHTAYIGIQFIWHSAIRKETAPKWDTVMDRRGEMREIGEQHTNHMEIEGHCNVYIQIDLPINICTDFLCLKVQYNTDWGCKICPFPISNDRVRLEVAVVTL